MSASLVGSEMCIRDRSAGLRACGRWSAGPRSASPWVHGARVSGPWSAVHGPWSVAPRSVVCASATQGPRVR
eukprot:15012594-Alexandrium_andersonii.AAC.1